MSPLAAEEIVQGHPDGAYHPAATVTRDQMAVYIQRAFNPTYTKGFYMHYEKGHVKSHAFSALPWSFVQDYENDWMIRVHLREEGK